MAPAGSYESLMAAIKAGADSVYFGVKGLNMRSGSAYSFTIEDLGKIAEICREHGILSYLTVNTVIYDHDMELMRQIIDAAKAAQISAIIASDVAAMQYAHQVGVQVHLSTQLNISNVEALRFYAQFADVVVLARELDLDQVEYIHKAILSEPILGPSRRPIRIEMFAHGALCMAVSGKCYLSLHETNRSANRGSCSQVCRRAYRVHDLSSDIELDVENPNIMSPKDLKTIHFINKMIAAGVRVFKLEGRARGPEYVYTVVHAYREALNAVADGSYSDARIAEWDEQLATVFNRGFWDGYYLGRRLGEWTHSYGSSATRVKVGLGKVVKYYSRLGVAEFVLESGELAIGDEILVSGPTTGALMQQVEEIRYELTAVDKAVKGWHISIPVREKVRAGDRLYKMEVKENGEGKY